MASCFASNMLIFQVGNGWVVVRRNAPDLEPGLLGRKLLEHLDSIWRQQLPQSNTKLRKRSIARELTNTIDRARGAFRHLQIKHPRRVSRQLW
jgi:hypothetical protein